MSENVPVELVEQVVEITACPEDEAKHLLAACANNVEAAVALFFEQGAGAGGVSDSGGATTSAAAAAAAAASRSTPPVQLIDDDDGDGVRAPIAPIREQLIMPEDDNFYVAAPPPSRIARSSQRVKICPLRDFAREAALMEEQLLAPGERMIANHLPEDLGGIGSFGSRRAANMVSTAQAAPKHSRLVDLFRPPTDLIYAGTFHIARKHATNLKQWLLVNLQTGNFDSQILNRDVWSDKRLRKLVRRHFVLWQVDADSNEGRRFAAFYKCSKLPYVCVIDPRTGEEVLKILEPKLSNVMPDLQQFLIEHKDFALEDAPSTSKRSMPIIVDDDDEDDSDTAKANGGFAAQSSSSEGSTKKRAKILELSEEEQIAMAIRNSMRENGGGAKNGKNKTKNVDDDDGDDDDDDDDDGASDFGSIEEFTDDDTKTASELMSYEQLLGSAKDEITMLKVRLLNAEGAEEIVQLKWPSDTTCKALRAYIAQVHSYIPKKDKNYKIISAFPRKTLEESHNDATLKELGLHPSANLHVTLD